MKFVRFLAPILILVACQQPEAPQQAAAPAPAPAPVPVAAPAPPPPPETSLGKLVKAETAPSTKVRVQYLTTSGLKSDVETREAEKGKMFVVLHFEKKKAEEPKKSESGLVTLQAGDGGRLESTEGGEPEVWLTDATGAKYTDWMALFEKESGHIAFEVPSTATGFVLHDGKEKTYPVPIK